MKLSELTGDYDDIRGLTDRQHYTAAGGETVFPLDFYTGSEEVFINGNRSTEYTAGHSLIYLNDSLAEGDELILIGRSEADFHFKSSMVEAVKTEATGQLSIEFSCIETDGIEVYVPTGRLFSPVDFQVRDSNSITLSSAIPKGTTVTGVQVGREYPVVPGDMVVDDGMEMKSLTERFSSLQESRPFFIESRGTRLMDLTQGARLSSRDDQYPTLRMGGTYLSPGDIGGGKTYIVHDWISLGNEVRLSVTTDTSEATEYITYRIFESPDSKAMAVADSAGTDEDTSRAINELLRTLRFGTTYSNKFMYIDGTSYGTLAEFQTAGKAGGDQVDFGGGGETIDASYLFKDFKGKNISLSFDTGIAQTVGRGQFENMTELTSLVLPDGFGALQTDSTDQFKNLTSCASISIDQVTADASNIRGSLTTAGFVTASDNLIIRS